MPALAYPVSMAWPHPKHKISSINHHQRRLCINGDDNLMLRIAVGEHEDINNMDINDYTS